MSVQDRLDLMVLQEPPEPREEPVPQDPQAFPDPLPIQVRRVPPEPQDPQDPQVPPGSQE